MLGFPGSSAGKDSACNVRDLGLIPGLGRSSGEENGNPLQYSSLENSMDRGAWQAIVHRVTKSRTGLSHFNRGRVRLRNGLNYGEEACSPACSGKVASYSRTQRFLRGSGRQ